MSTQQAVSRKLGTDEPRITQYQTFDDMVDNLRQELCTTEKLILRVRWFIGCQAYILMESRKYGDHSVEEFAEAIGLSASSIYEARKFYISYTREELDQRLIERQVSYRRALAMARCKDEDQRQIIEDAAYEESLSDEDVESLIKAVNGGMKLPEEPAEVKEVLAVLARKRDEEDGEDEEDGDDDVPAVGEEDSERKLIRRIRGACSDADNACAQVTATLASVKAMLDDLSALSEAGYPTAEKLFMETALSVRSATLSLYETQKALTAHNIVIRG